MASSSPRASQNTGPALVTQPTFSDAEKAQTRLLYNFLKSLSSINNLKKVKLQWNLIKSYHEQINNSTGPTCVRVRVCVRERDPSVDARKYIFQPYALLMHSKNLYS